MSFRAKEMVSTNLWEADRKEFILWTLINNSPLKRPTRAAIRAGMGMSINGFGSLPGLSLALYF
jgi:hypothetical protein